MDMSQAVIYDGHVFYDGIAPNSDHGPEKLRPLSKFLEVIKDLEQPARFLNCTIIGMQEQFVLRPGLFIDHCAFIGAETADGVPFVDQHPDCVEGNAAFENSILSIAMASVT